MKMLAVTNTRSNRSGRWIEGDAERRIVGEGFTHIVDDHHIYAVEVVPSQEYGGRDMVLIGDVVVRRPVVVPVARGGSWAMHAVMTMIVSAVVVYIALMDYL